jgi:hypothetical protein
MLVRKITGALSCFGAASGALKQAATLVVALDCHQLTGAHNAAKSTGYCFSYLFSGFPFCLLGQGRVCAGPGIHDY